MQSLGDRIKRYENVTRGFLTPRMPVVVRVDGRAFHSYTKGCKKPFDSDLMSIMVHSAMLVSKDIQGFKAAYIQSDEASFVFTDYDDIDSQGYFNYNHQKIVSNTAAIMTAHFNAMPQKIGSNPAIFDSRAFNVPREDVVNYFVWRAKDWERNSLQMYARSIFSHKQLHGKNKEDIHEMLHQQGYNWATDLTDREKNGTFIISGEDLRSDIKPNYESINEAIGWLI